MTEQTQAPFVIPDGGLASAMIRVACEAFLLSLRSQDDSSLCLAFERVVAVVRHPYVVALQALRTETRSSLADTETALAETKALMAEKEGAWTPRARSPKIKANFVEKKVEKVRLPESEAPLASAAASAEMKAEKLRLPVTEAPLAVTAAWSTMEVEIANKQRIGDRTRESQESLATAQGSSVQENLAHQEESQGSVLGGQYHRGSKHPPRRGKKAIPMSYGSNPYAGGGG